MGKVLIAAFTIGTSVLLVVIICANFTIIGRITPGHVISHGVSPVDPGARLKSSPASAEVQDLKERVGLLEAFIEKKFTVRVRPVDGCHGELDMIEAPEDNSSQLAASTWDADILAGTFKLNLRASGKMVLHMKHADKSWRNTVVVFLNNEEVLVLQKGSATLCIMVEAGDLLRIQELWTQGDHPHSKLRDLVQRLTMTCGEVRPPEDMFPLVDSSFEEVASLCLPNREVWTRTRRCGQEFVRGHIDRVLNDTRVIVETTANATSSVDSIIHAVRWQDFSPDELIVKQGNQFAKCRHVLFKRAPNVGIVTVADRKYADKFEPHAKSIRCYAAARGYEYELIEPSMYVKECGEVGEKDLDVFFKKHCIIAQWLAEKPDGYVLAVIDIDVIALALKRGLEEWYLTDSDVHFYDRAWNAEIAAGNYMVRNGRHTRKFLMDWADYDNKRPVGWSSWDNGAIHLHILETLQLEGTNACRKLYYNLTAKKVSKQYWDFILCTKDVLGRPRTWQVPGGWRLSMWPRLSFWVEDGYNMNQVASNHAGHVMVHGLKDPAKVTPQFYINLDKCVVNKDRALKSRTELEIYRLSYVQANQVHKEFGRLYLAGADCIQCMDRCIKDFSCRPLRHNESDGAPIPRQMITSGGT